MNIATDLKAPSFTPGIVPVAGESTTERASIPYAEIIPDRDLKLNLYSYGTLDSVVKRIYSALGDHGSSGTNEFIGAAMEPFHVAAQGISANSDPSSPESLLKALSLARDRFKDDIEARDLDDIRNDRNPVFSVKHAASIALVTAAMEDEEREALKKAQRGFGGPSLAGLFSNFGQDGKRFKDTLNTAMVDSKVSSINDSIKTLRGNVGDPVWEKEHGITLARKLQDDLAFIQESIRDNPHRFDVESIKRSMKAGKAEMNDLLGKAMDPGLVEEIQKAAEKFAQAIARALAKVFGKK